MIARAWQYVANEDGVTSIEYALIASLVSITIIGTIHAMSANLLNIFVAVNNGFLAIECKDIAEQVNDGDQLELDVEKGAISNLTKGETYKFSPLAEFALQMIEAGGLLEYVKKHTT